MYILKSCFIAIALLLGNGGVDAAVGKKLRRDLQDMPSHDHDHDANEDRIPGTEECGKCKHGCADEDQAVIDLIFGTGTTFVDSGECKGACSDLYGSHYCMCGGDLCSKYDYDRIPGTHECGACKTACSKDDTERVDYIFGETTSFGDSGECKGACSDLFGSHNCMCGPHLCSKFDEDRIPGTHECGACKTACHNGDTDRLEYIFDAPTDFESFPSSECKAACSDKYGSHYCMCSDSLCSAYDDDRIEGTHECGACKTACSRDDQERLDYIFGEGFDLSGGCKSACQDKFGDDHCMCGNSLCTEYDDGEPHSHDSSSDERIPGTEDCGVCKHACADNDTDKLMELFDTMTPTGGTSDSCKGACEDMYGSHYCMCGDNLCSKYEEDRIPGTEECGACKTACSKEDWERVDYIFGVPTTFESSGDCKGACMDKFGNHNCMCGNELCSKYEEDRIPSTHECGACKTACHYGDVERIDYIFGVPTAFESFPSGDCKGACVEKYGSHYCMCGPDICSASEEGRIEGTHECGACKSACSRNDQDRLDYIFGEGFDLSGGCKSACQDKFGDEHCMCGNSLCTEFDDGEPHTHSSDDDDERIPGTEACGECKHACADENQAVLDTIFDAGTTFSDSGACKEACSVQFGSHYCMCGDDLCSKYDEDRIPGTEECGACKTACSKDDTERVNYIFGVPTNFEDSGQCKGACVDKFGSHYCMCGPDLCSKSDEGRIEGTHECGACKSACSRNDQDRIDYIFGESSEFESSGPCKGACQDKYGREHCMCGDSLCTEFEDGESHSHDWDESVDSHDHDGNSAEDLACADDNFSILCGLIQACPETATGPITVFAPTNAAFAELDAAVNGLENVEPDILCGILEFHIHPGEALYSKDLMAYCDAGDASLISMANGVNARIKCSREDGGEKVPTGIKGGGNDQTADFVEVDIVTTDGVVHTIDNVLFYPQVFMGNNVGGSDIVPSLRGALP